MVRFQSRPRAVLLALALVAAATSALAGTIFVDANNNSGIEDGTPSFPYNTINEALAVSLAGDVLSVAPGFYGERLDIPVGRQVVSSAGALSTILDGGAAGSVVTFNGSLIPTTLSTSIIGFTIRNGQSTLGAGVLIVQGEPVVSRNLIMGSLATLGGAFGGFGGGIEVYRTRAKVTNNVVIANRAEFVGGGIDIYRSPLAVVSNNTVVGNIAEPLAGGNGSGGGMAATYTGPLSLSNNVVTSNTAGAYGGGIYIYAAAIFTLMLATVLMDRLVRDGRR